MMRKTYRSALAVTLVALVGTTACGSDKKSSSTVASTVVASTAAPSTAAPSTAASAATTSAAATSAATGSTGTGGAGASSDYCTAELAVETTPQPNIDDSAPEADQTKALTAFFQELLTRAKKVQAAAPASLQADVTTAIAGLQAAVTSGDPSAAETPAIDTATTSITNYSEANCGWTPVHAVATEYKYTGIPATLKAGVTNFHLDNKGEEAHEITIFRKNDGVTLDAKALLALPQEQAESMVTMVAEDEVDPGQTDSTVAVLTPGNYVYACFIPVGSVPGQTPEEGAEPHFMEGMYGEFTVS